MANAKITTILDLAIQKASKSKKPVIGNNEVINRIELIARNTQNRACVRFIMACSLAKIDKPSIDIRKPYTEIGDDDSFSGRTYDEGYITEFVNQYELPCNSTTAFLTPAFRNRNAVLTPYVNLVGRPESVYKATLQLLDDVYQRKLTADELLTETVRWLLIVRDEKRQRMSSLLAGLKAAKGETSLPAEGIVNLIEQHLKLKNSSRLPVLVVAAAYEAASAYLGEQLQPLQGHNAADKQTGSLGDLEITLIDEQQLVTSYEMKTRKVTKNDIDHAVDKVIQSNQPVQNYIFITTEVIDQEVVTYAYGIYEKTGVEMVVLDCIGFLRHFLHLFYRLRMGFLEAYQELLLVEPESAVNQPLKEAFLALRQAAETQGNQSSLYE
ncbi:MAG: restriction endonuclease, SacI family [Methylococcales bacterium]|nr:restriction endonuclease, SacI family [Methylococcales bacterium]